MANEQLLRRQKVGFLQQSKATNHWNASATEHSNYRTTNYDAGVSFPKRGIMTEQSNPTSSYGLHEEVEKFYIDTHADLPTIPFSAIANKGILAGHFAAILQKVTEGETTPNAKTISSAFALGNGLDFAGNEGYLFTVALDNFNDGVDQSEGFILKNALINDLTFEVQPNNKGIPKLATIKGTWIGNDYADLQDTLFDGIWITKPTNDKAYSGKFQLNLTTDTLSFTDLLYRRAAINLNLNIQPDLKTAGKAQKYNITPKFTAEFDIPYLDGSNGGHSTYKLEKAYTSGENIAFTLETGTAGQDGHLKFQATNGRISSEPKTANGEYHALRLSLDLLSPGGSSPLVVTIADALDWGL